MWFVSSVWGLCASCSLSCLWLLAWLLSFLRLGVSRRVLETRGISAVCWDSAGEKQLRGEAKMGRRLRGLWRFRTSAPCAESPRVGEGSVLHAGCCEERRGLVLRWGGIPARWVFVLVGHSTGLGGGGGSGRAGPWASAPAPHSPPWRWALGTTLDVQHWAGGSPGYWFYWKTFWGKNHLYWFWEKATCGPIYWHLAGDKAAAINLYHEYYFSGWILVPCSHYMSPYRRKCWGFLKG